MKELNYTEIGQHLSKAGLSAEELLDLHETMVSNIAAAVIYSLEDGRVALCSPYAEVLTGFPTDYFYSDHRFFESLCVEEDLDRFRRARMIAELGEDSLVRHRVNHQSGLQLWLETRLVPVLTGDGEVEGIMSVSTDVTALVCNQLQIEEQNRDLADFAYMVSHDLKAPIFTIKGMASAIAEDFGEQLGGEGNELLNYISAAAARLETLVASVIEFSSASSKPIKESNVDLRRVVADVIHDHAKQIESCAAKIEISNDLPTIKGDQVRLYQIFSNLIGNAIKYRSKDRPLVISVTNRPISGPRVLIEVSDNGLGIPADKLEDIFRPYHRAHGSAIEGNGIGLACVKKVVERLRGTVSVKSTMGSGSSFFITLPAASSEPQAIPPELTRCFES